MSRVVDVNIPDTASVPRAHAIGSYAALGDSFTEGVGDPGADGALVGWADRFAAALAEGRPAGALRYANLAVRGRLLDRIVAEQVPAAVRLAPDLVTFAAGGNDILRPGTDPDDVAERFEAAVERLTAAAGTVMVATGFDTRDMPVLRHLRGKIATYNAHLRAIADRNHCLVLDLWALRALRDRRAWNEDRLHLSPEGHARVAALAALALDAPVATDPYRPWPPQPPVSTAAARRETLRWTREYFVPWIGRRLRGRSSGDDVTAKRPELLPL
jgi:lysophospholipase L1-like esterase